MSDEEDYQEREEEEEPQEEEPQEEAPAPASDEEAEERGSPQMPPHGYPAPVPPSGHLGPKQYDETHAHYKPVDREAGEPFWEYSNCSGTRKAFLVGINYTGLDVGELNGCHGDVDRMKDFLMEKYEFQEDNIRILKDDPEMGEDEQPTKANILAGMQWLVEGAQKHDSLFFHYSGHGGQVKDLDGDEDDGFDECIYPVDCQTAGEIIDDQMHDIMVNPLQAGTRLTCLYDSCHSGSALDLPYNYATSGNIKDPLISQLGKKELLEAGKKMAKGDAAGALAGLMQFSRLTMGERKDSDQKREAKQSAADVIMLSGCKDNQTSADATEDDVPTGALSWAFMKTINELTEITYSQLLNTVRDTLKEKKYAQKPQLSSSHPMDLDLVFVA